MGSFQGYMHYLPAKIDGGYETESWMKNKDGEAIHLGQYWHLTQKKWTKEEIAPTIKPSILLYPKLIDWDQDGDLDLLLGGRSGTIAILLNEGTKLEPKFATNPTFLKAAGEIIDHKFHASVDMVDLDGDKLADLVCASSNDGLTIYKNIGSLKAPSFAKGQLVHQFGNEGPADYPCVSVADLNGDAKPDIVVGSKDQNRKSNIWIYHQK